jgi:hypothetical protein
MYIYQNKVLNITMISTDYYFRYDSTIVYAFHIPHTWTEEFQK